MPRTIEWLLALLVAGLPTATLAHEQKAALSRLLFNPNTGNLEVMHRFYVHDAEHAARQLFDPNLNLIESAEARELFAQYVINRFALAAIDAQGLRISLAFDYVGQEIEGRYLWVYQEVAQPLGTVRLEVVAAALKDVWPDQDTLVNVEKDGRVYSVDLSGTKDAGEIPLAP